MGTIRIAGKRSYFWENLIRAAEAEPQEARSIRGKSGLAHPVVALGVDEARSRLVIVSAEHDARTTALAQVDIQAALPSMHVVMARPVILHLGHFAEKILVSPQDGSPDPSRLLKLNSLNDEAHEFKSYRDKIGATFDIAPLDIPSQILQLVSIVSRLDWSELEKAVKAGAFEPQKRKRSKKSSSAESESNQERGTLMFANVLLQLLEHDPIKSDREAGICPLPLYEFSADEIEAIRSGSVTELQQLLRHHQLMQYFFPPSDQLALGIVERTKASPSQLVSHLLEVPGMGHPFGPSEISVEPTTLPRMVEILQEKNLIVEGDFGMELTEKGQTIRASIKFRPREGLLEKIISRFKLSIDLKNMIGKP